ncbi:hypothetical protein AC579_2660 [Pseudocercospora musae]|uniref:Uncharacterized protein n=1 Tax=Pseudocercospora musae TaxID=113226 RepID=A0A139HKN7_9PEZI|nr:hypothetical protein AC579_2660 [Pseudocercospora musae]
MRGSRLVGVFASCAVCYTTASPFTNSASSAHSAWTRTTATSCSSSACQSSLSAASTEWPLFWPGHGPQIQPLGSPFPKVQSSTTLGYSSTYGSTHAPATRPTHYPSSPGSQTYLSARERCKHLHEQFDDSWAKDAKESIKGVEEKFYGAASEGLLNPVDAREIKPHLIRASEDYDRIETQGFHLVQNLRSCLRLPEPEPEVMSVTFYNRIEELRYKAEELEYRQFELEFDRTEWLESLIDKAIKNKAVPGSAYQPSRPPAPVPWPIPFLPLFNSSGYFSNASRTSQDDRTTSLSVPTATDQDRPQVEKTKEAMQREAALGWRGAYPPFLAARTCHKSLARLRNLAQMYDTSALRIRKTIHVIEHEPLTAGDQRIACSQLGQELGLLKKARDDIALAIDQFHHQKCPAKPGVESIQSKLFHKGLHYPNVCWERCSSDDKHNETSMSTPKRDVNDMDHDAAENRKCPKAYNQNCMANLEQHIVDLEFKFMEEKDSEVRLQLRSLMDAVKRGRMSSCLKPCPTYPKLPKQVWTIVSGIIRAVVDLLRLNGGHPHPKHGYHPSPSSYHPTKPTSIPDYCLSLGVSPSDTRMCNLMLSAGLSRPKSTKVANHTTFPYSTSSHTTMSTVHATLAPACISSMHGAGSSSTTLSILSSATSKSLVPSTSHPQPHPPATSSESVTSGSVMPHTSAKSSHSSKPTSSSKSSISFKPTSSSRSTISSKSSSLSKPTSSQSHDPVYPVPKTHSTTLVRHTYAAQP